MNKKIPSKEYIEEWIKNVRFDPYDIKNCEYQTEEICLAAVEVYGWSIEYVKKQTPKICLTAIENDYSALQYVKEQTFDIVWEAYKQSKYSLKYAKPEFQKMVERKLKIDRLIK